MSFENGALLPPHSFLAKKLELREAKVVSISVGVEEGNIYDYDGCGSQEDGAPDDVDDVAANIRSTCAWLLRRRLAAGGRRRADFLIASAWQ